MKKQYELFGTEADIDNSKPLEAFHQCEDSDRKSTRLNSSHSAKSRMPSSA